LGELGRATGIEDASDGGLLDELVAAPSLSEQAVGTNGGIDLRNDLAASQQSDEEIEQGRNRVGRVGWVSKVDS
jgi:hypothetical protein